MGGLILNLGFREVEKRLHGGEKVDRLLNSRWMFRTEKERHEIEFSLRPVLTKQEFFRLGPLAVRTISEFHLNVHLSSRKPRLADVLLSTADEAFQVSFCTLLF
jgi:hypothetical protein